MPDQTSSAETVGVILAGGTAQRLGLALKSALNVGGENLLDRVVHAVRDSCGTIIVSVGEHGHNSFAPHENCIVLSDAGEGPASALRKSAEFAAARYQKVRFLLCVAVDTPFLPRDFALRAQEVLAPDVDAVVGAFGDQVYPTNALWRMPALQPENNHSTPAAPRSLFGMLDNCRWVKLDYAQIQESNPFLNVNTPSDLVEANRRARSS